MRNATEFLQTEQLGQMATKLKDFDVVKMHNKNQQLNLEQSVFCNVYRSCCRLLGTALPFQFCVTSMSHSSHSGM